MHTLKLLSRACSVVPSPSRSELKNQLSNMCVAGDGAVALIRQNALSVCICTTSILKKRCFRNYNHATTSMVHPGYFCGMGRMRPFSTALTSCTSVLRTSRPLSKTGAKSKNRAKRDRSRRQSPEDKTRDVLKTEIATPEPYFDEGFYENYDHDNEARTAISRPDSAPSSTATPESTATAPEAMGWDYETVDPVTGKTPIDFLYESHLDRIQQILERPLPPMPPDGNINPDFFVGFLYYNYRLRDQYRTVIAHELQVPVQAVKLSVAWSGRFDVSRFNQVKKVCGVHLDREVLPGASAQPIGKPGPQEEAHSRLPEAIRERIVTLIRDINGRRTQHLLQVQLFQASDAIPEVEFALSRREHQLLSHLHSWIRANILGSSLAVIVRGGNLDLYRNYERHLSGQVDSKRMDDLSSSGDDTHANSSSVPIHKGLPIQAYEEWLAKETAAAAQQQRFIETKWLRQFYSREIIPRQLSLRDVAALVTQAVLRGEVDQVRIPPHPEVSPSKKGTTNAGACEGENQTASSKVEPENCSSASAAARGCTLLSDDQVSLLCQCQDHLQREVQSNQVVSESQTEKGYTSVPPRVLVSEACLFSNDNFMRTLEENLQSIALQWICTIRRALFLHDEGTSITGSPISSGISIISLPALFVHRAYSGGLVEMRYLASNKAAMDALLLHPNDITMKKAFARRLRNGHRRLRIYEEMDTSRPGA